MAKDKDLNDAAQEAAATGKLPHLKLVDATFDLGEAPNFLEIMNKKHAFVNTIGGKPMVLSYTYSEVYDKEIIEFRSPESIITQYCNQVAEIGKNSGPITLGKWWIGHIDRREYETVTFEPDKKPGEYMHTKLEKKYFNLWEGFAVESKKGIWKKTLKHLYIILCNKNPEKFKYLVRWVAWTLQNPGQRAEVAVVLKGRKGAGKGFIFTQLVKIFGRHGMSISNSEHLVGRYNAHLMLLSFLFADEAYYPGDKEVEGALKQLITEPYLTVEPKFQNTKLSKNCLHIGMATNNDWVIPASDDERRYFINEVDHKYAKNKIDDNIRQKYFGEIWQEMEYGGREAMLYDLLRMNLNNWHPRDNIPETEELMRQISMSMPRKDKVIVSFLDNGVFPGKRSKKNEYTISSTTLNEYIEKIDPGSIKISIKMKAMVLQEIGVLPVRLSEGRGWIFPPLTELKHKWNKVKGRYDWADYNDWILPKEEPIDTI